MPVTHAHHPRRCCQDGDTALMAASAYGSLDIAELLLDSGATKTIDAQNNLVRSIFNDESVC